MSNFICPTCGFTNIDCGKDGYKTPKEIELENKIYKQREEHVNECLMCDKIDFHQKISELESKLEIFNDEYFKGLDLHEIAELSKKSIRLTMAHCEDQATIERLKELLFDCRVAIKFNINKEKHLGFTPSSALLIDKINKALAEIERKEIWM